MLDILKLNYVKIIKLIDLNRNPCLIFFISLFVFLSFASTRMFFSDEGVILNQFYNLVHGSLDLQVAKMNVERGVFITVGNHIYGKFSYSLPILSLPAYIVLRIIDPIYGAHLFLLQLWALSGGISFYLAAKIWKKKNAVVGGFITYFILITVNLQSFKPIYFPKWGELLAIEFTNILLTSLLVVVIYILFRSLFGHAMGLFASVFIIFATPISFYAVTLKHHSLSLFLAVLAFFCFFEYLEKKKEKFIYFAYIAAGFCIWTRILDGVALLSSLLITDIFVLRRSIRHILISLIITIVSLLPFFIFNYLILGNPLSIIEAHPLSDKPMVMQDEKNMIILNESPLKNMQIELLDRLGFTWVQEIKTGLMQILLDITVLRLKNTFGILLISPFLASALAFVIESIKRRIRLNAMDKFFGLYLVISILLSRDYILSIVTDTPMVLEYRYLLIIYIILLYFALRVDRVRFLIESGIKKILLMYSVTFAGLLFYFIYFFPPPFLNIYQSLAQVTLGLLILLLLINLVIKKENRFQESLNRLTAGVMAISFAEASSLLLFYNWVVIVTYISPTQNHTILPILQNILDWMYQTVLIH